MHNVSYGNENSCNPPLAYIQVSRVLFDNRSLQVSPALNIKGLYKRVHLFFSAIVPKEPQNMQVILFTVMFTVMNVKSFTQFF